MLLLLLVMGNPLKILIIVYFALPKYFLVYFLSSCSKTEELRLIDPKNNYLFRRRSDLISIISKLIFFYFFLFPLKSSLFSLSNRGFCSHLIEWGFFVRNVTCDFFYPHLIIKKISLQNNHCKLY